MKFGIRKINLKSSIKARTIGKAKRKVKKSLDPRIREKGYRLGNKSEEGIIQ